LLERALQCAERLPLIGARLQCCLLGGQKSQLRTQGRFRSKQSAVLGGKVGVEQCPIGGDQLLGLTHPVLCGLQGGFRPFDAHEHSRLRLLEQGLSQTQTRAGGSDLALMLVEQGQRDASAEHQTVDTLIALGAGGDRRRPAVALGLRQPQGGLRREHLLPGGANIVALFQRLAPQLR
jgi:hypothetical protein